MKLLISWIAYNNDFEQGKVDLENSPNYLMHNHFYNYDKHYILCAAVEDDTRLQVLLNRLRLDFPEHPVEGVYMGIKDVINLPEIKEKIEAFLFKQAEHEMDLFFSPGTSIMQLAWFICHNNLKYNTRLIQMRRPKDTRGGIPELLEVQVEQSKTPITSILKEQNIEKKERTPYDVKGQKLTASLKPVYDKARKIAKTDRVTTLLMGKSGTGKESLAKYIHDQSVRSEYPFVVINCSAFNDTLIESRMFGYKKGAFTGAYKDTPGLFEKADGGTVFLDEIGDISPYMQQALLRVIQEKEIQPIGGKPKKIDVRIISATNKDLIKMCEEETFRWDLYYRLAVAELELPTLLERGPGEIREMIHYFLKQKKKELKKERLLTIDKKALQFLKNYPYPGNIRELENLIESFYVFCDEQITIDDIPSRIQQIPEEESLHWKDAEKAHIKRVLQLKNGNQRQAWLALGYGSLNTLKKKIEEYGIKTE